MLAGEHWPGQSRDGQHSSWGTGAPFRPRGPGRPSGSGALVDEIDRKDNCLSAANFADSVPCSTEPADPMFRYAQPILPLLALLAVWSGAARAAEPGSIFLRYEVRSAVSKPSVNQP